MIQSTDIYNALIAAFDQVVQDFGTGINGWFSCVPDTLRLPLSLLDERVTFENYQHQKASATTLAGCEVCVDGSVTGAGLIRLPSGMFYIPGSQWIASLTWPIVALHRFSINAHRLSLLGATYSIYLTPHSAQELPWEENPSIQRGDLLGSIPIEINGTTYTMVCCHKDQELCRAIIRHSQSVDVGELLLELAEMIRSSRIQPSQRVSGG